MMGGLHDTSPAPTPYPAVNAVLRRLRDDLHATLGAALTGLYVHGSLALGDFNPQRSDIDFVAATGGELGPAQQDTLAAMHRRLTGSGLPWADRLEGSYIPVVTLRRYDPAQSHHPALRVDGVFAVDGHGSDWVIQRHVIREWGIVLSGPPPQALIDPVTPHALRAAARGILAEWWAPQLVEHFRLASDEYQAYAVLTMCRSLYTVAQGAVTGKHVAAQWAAAAAPAWWPLIERALAWGHGMTLDARDETLAFIRYTLEATGAAGEINVPITGS